MKTPGIFELTRREQRAVVLIIIGLLATAAVKRYRDRQTQAVPATSAPAQAHTAQSASPLQSHIAESESP
jgi:hypothetical protein